MDSPNQKHTFPITISKDLSVALLEQSAAKRMTINQIIEDVLLLHILSCKQPSSEPCPSNYFDDDEDDNDYDPYQDNFTDAY